MANKGYECFECDAVFKIRHDLETEYYTVGFCPFCGEAMDDEQEFEYEEDNDS
jgi:hypothetical protein